MLCCIAVGPVLRAMRVTINCQRTDMKLARMDASTHTPARCSPPLPRQARWLVLLRPPRALLAAEGLVSREQPIPRPGYISPLPAFFSSSQPAVTCSLQWFGSSINPGSSDYPKILRPHVDSLLALPSGNDDTVSKLSARRK